MDICRRHFGRRVLGGVSAALLRGATTRPKLLVIVLLEQFRADLVDAVRAQLPPGGFRRLQEKSSFYYTCVNRSSTFPMASLATFATGAWPAQHGIVAERWYDPDSRSLVSASEELLSAETLAAGVAADSRSRVTVIGHERAHAALFAGTPDARLYWLDELGRFASNGETQDWLAAFNAQKTSESARNARWMALGAKPDAAPLRTLTYTAERANDYLLLWRSSPFSMAAQFDLLNELLARENPGKGPGLDVYCLLAGSMEQLGYETGGRSPLMEQMALHADRRIEGLLAQLARTAGENGFTLAVAGAHGAP